MRLLQQGDVLKDIKTGILYRVHYIMPKLCRASPGYYDDGEFTVMKTLQAIKFRRDTTHGIRTYTKSKRVFTLKPTETI